MIILLQSGASQITEFPRQKTFFALEGMLFTSSLWLSLTESMGPAKKLYLIIVRNINHLLYARAFVNKQHREIRAVPRRLLLFFLQAHHFTIMKYDRDGVQKTKTVHSRTPLPPAVHAAVEEYNKAGARDSIINY